MFNDDPYRNAVLSRSERLRAGRESTSEFDQIFESMNAPDYPATCDRCGMEGTNASMEEHVCDESPASRTGERERVEYSPLPWRVVVDDTGDPVTGGYPSICADRSLDTTIIPL